MTQLVETNSREIHELLLGETKDFGVGELRSIQTKRSVLGEAFDFLSLEGVFSGVPAIVIGAAPSLKIDGKDLISSLQDKALILSGGSALEWLEKKKITPHFSLLFDPHCKQERFKKVKKLGSRALFTLRANTSVVTSWKGPKWLLSTEAFHLWETAYSPTKNTLNVGWNVATALGAFAEFLGCSSILFIGVDLDHGKNGEIYPEGILTTPDDVQRETRELEWKLAREWLSSFIESATEKGISIFGGESSPLNNIAKMALSEYIATYCKESQSIESILLELEKGDRALLGNSLEEFEKTFKQSYINTWKICDAFFVTSQIEPLFLEPFYQKILHPLWKIWSPRFKEVCELRNIPWMEREQEIAFIMNVQKTYDQSKAL